MQDPVPDPHRPSPSQARFPRVPAHAWRWLQRSRPVLVEVARRLSGGPPTAEFFEALQRRFGEDPFTRAIVCDVIAEVAFSGRVPPRRPSGSSWDRGLVWWAATLVGTTPSEYDRPPSPGDQARLFVGPEGPDPTAPASSATRGRAPGPAPLRGERAALAAALRSLLDSAEGGSVPAESIRALLAELEGDQRR